MIVVSSASADPIEKSRRLLVTALARVEPTGYRWVDEWKRDVADPGVPPLLREPVSARIHWRGKGGWKAFALDNNGIRIATATLSESSDGKVLEIAGTASNMHWELVAE